MTAAADDGYAAELWRSLGLPGLATFFPDPTAAGYGGDALAAVAVVWKAHLQVWRVRPPRRPPRWP